MNRNRATEQTLTGLMVVKAGEEWRGYRTHRAGAGQAPRREAQPKGRYSLETPR